MVGPVLEKYAMSPFLRYDEGRGMVGTKMDLGQYTSLGWRTLRSTKIRGEGEREDKWRLITSEPKIYLYPIFHGNSHISVLGLGWTEFRRTSRTPTNNKRLWDEETQSLLSPPSFRVRKESEGYVFSQSSHLDLTTGTFPDEVSHREPTVDPRI